MNEEYCYVMDYSNGGLYEIKLTPEEQEETLDMQAFLFEYGLKDDECAWMFTNKRIVTIDRIEKL